MKHMRVAFLLTIAAAAAGCASGGGPIEGPPPPGPTPLVTLTASPSTYTFALNDTTPISVFVARNVGTLSGFTATVANPQEFGVSFGVSGAVAQVVVLPIAGGSTTALSFADSSGATTTASVTPASCGRPDNLNVASSLIYPAPGAAGVSTNIGTLYFAVFSTIPIASTTKLHLIVGTNATLEGGTLQPGTPPGGAPTPAPLPGLIETIASATVPTLPSGASIRTQLYDDVCQPPLLTGAFST